MTEKQIKKAQKILCGRNLSFELRVIAVILMMLITTISFHIILFLFPSYFYDDELFVNVFINSLLIFSWLIILSSIFLLLRHYSRCKLLKERYEQITESSKKQLLMLAGNYKFKDGVCFNSDFIYGGMVMSKSSRIKLFNMMIFTYIPINDLTWVYKTEPSMIGTSAYSASIALGAPNVDWLFAYTYDGKCYRGITKNMDFFQLSHLISSKNANCLLGYSKDNEKKIKLFN